MSAAHTGCFAQRARLLPRPAHARQAQAAALLPPSAETERRRGNDDSSTTSSQSKRYVNPT